MLEHPDPSPTAVEVKTVELAKSCDATVVEQFIEAREAKGREVKPKDFFPVVVKVH